MSRHLLTRPGRYSARAAYLQPALRSGACDYRRGRRSVSRSLRRTGVPSGSPGHGGLGRRKPGADDFGVYAHDPRHVAAAVPWCLYIPDSHGAAWVEDKEADPGNVPGGRVVTVFVPL